jgi:hypothetical protein
MPSDTDTGAYDAQDSAEVFDEDATTGDQDLSDAMDIRRNVQDVTSAAGDEDLEGDDDEMDAADETDDDLDEIAEVQAQQDEDDLDDDNSDDDVLAGDDVPDYTSDRDSADADDVDGVSRHPSAEPAIVSMGDVDALGGETGLRTADLESDALSDSDLEELDYKEA